MGVSWGKSTYSKSSYSMSNGACIEVGEAKPFIVVCDSKQDKLGGERTILHFTDAAWRTFIGKIKGNNE